MDKAFRNALAVSVIIHAGIVAPLYGQNLLKPDAARVNPVIVDYVILKDMALPTVTNISHRGSAINAVQKEALGIKGEAAQPRSAVKTHDRSEYRKKLAALKVKRAMDQAAKKEAAIKSSKDYIQYYEALKDKVKAKLQENYKFYRGEGDVYLSFALSSGGNLISYDIDRARSAHDEVLLHITATSLKAVSPFPPVPKALSTNPKISFNLAISFKK